MDRFLWATNPLNDTTTCMGYVIDTVHHHYYRVERVTGTQKKFRLCFEKCPDGIKLGTSQQAAKHWLIALLRKLEGGHITVSI